MPPRAPSAVTSPLPMCAPHGPRMGVFLLVTRPL
jgi:hypothetical protein